MPTRSMAGADEEAVGAAAVAVIGVRVVWVGSMGVTKRCLVLSGQRLDDAEGAKGVREARLRNVANAGAFMVGNTAVKCGESVLVGG